VMQATGGACRGKLRLRLGMAEQQRVLAGG
jgi:hypothetical protein